MIKINLLPADKRKAERTPLPRFGLIMANVAVATLLVFGLLLEYMNMKSTEDERIQKEAERATYLDSDAKFQELTALKGTLEVKNTELRGLVGVSSVEWWQILDAVWEVVHNNPKIWLDDVSSSDGTTTSSSISNWDPGRLIPPASPYGLNLSCHAAGIDVRAMTQFRHDLRTHPLLKKLFSEINFSLEWQVEEETDYLERFSLSFKVSLIGREIPAAPAPETPQ